MVGFCGSPQFGCHNANDEKIHRMTEAVKCILTGLGEDITREGLLDTPKRVSKALLECTLGYKQHVSRTLNSAVFNEPIVNDGGNGIVIVRDIDFASINEENFLPFHGRCHVGYVPYEGRVLGLSKMARLVRQFSKRLQSQSRLSQDLTVALRDNFTCQGVAIVVQATHLSHLTVPQKKSIVCTADCFSTEQSTYLEDLLSALGLEDLPPSCILDVNDACDAEPSNSSVSCSMLSLSGQPLTHDSTSLSSDSLSEHCSAEAEVDSFPTYSAEAHQPERDFSECCGCNGDFGQQGSFCKLPFPEIVASAAAPDGPDLASPSCLTNPDSERQSPPASVSEAAGAGAAPLESSSCPSCVRATAHRDLAGALTGSLNLPSPGASPAVLPSRSEMEEAVNELILELGEDVSRPALRSCAQAYISSLLCSTSGYHKCLPPPLPAAATIAALTAERTTPGCCTSSDVDPSSLPDLKSVVMDGGILYGRDQANSGHCPEGRGSKEDEAPQAGGRSCCSVVSSPSYLPTSFVRFERARHSFVLGGTETPVRVDACAGLEDVAAAALANQSGVAGTVEIQTVLVPFVSQCEHHMLPFYGTVMIACCCSTAESTPSTSSSPLSWAVSDDVVSYLVSMFTQRLQVQERITHQLADAIATAVVSARPVSGVHGVMVVCEAAHMCMVARGIESHSGFTLTYATRGSFQEAAASRLKTQVIRLFRRSVNDGTVVPPTRQ